MRVALLLSLLFLICGLAAFFGVPAVNFNGRPITGLVGLLIGLLIAAIPPVVVLGFRRLKQP